MTLKADIEQKHTMADKSNSSAKKGKPKRKILDYQDRITVRVSNQLYQDLTELAKEDQRTLSNLVNTILIAHVNKHKAQK